MRTVVMALAVLLSPSSGRSHETPLPAPYQVEGVVAFKSDRHGADGGLRLNETLVAVDLGTAKRKRPPGRKRFEAMTVIGSAGIAQGKLRAIRKVCDYLCGGEAEECHYQALLALDKPVAEIGTPLAALPQSPALSGFRPLTAAAATPFKALGKALLGGDFAPLAWSPLGRKGPQARITSLNPAGNGVVLQTRYRGGNSFTVPTPACRARQLEGLTELHCNGIALLVAGQTPLLYSYPDYNVSAAALTAAFELDGTAFHLVRLGLKAQTVFGLLYRDKSAWRGLFRPRDYALIC